MQVFTLKGYLVSYQFAHNDNSRNIHDEMVNKLFVASTTRNKMPPKKAWVRLRQSVVFFPFTYRGGGLFLLLYQLFCLL